MKGYSISYFFKKLKKIEKNYYIHQVAIIKYKIEIKLIVISIYNPSRKYQTISTWIYLGINWFKTIKEKIDLKK